MNRRLLALLTICLLIFVFAVVIYMMPFKIILAVLGAVFYSFLLVCIGYQIGKYV